MLQVIGSLALWQPVLVSVVVVMIALVVLPVLGVQVVLMALTVLVAILLIEPKLPPSEQPWQQSVMAIGRYLVLLATTLRPQSIVLKRLSVVVLMLLQGELLVVMPGHCLVLATVKDLSRMERMMALILLIALPPAAMVSLLSMVYPKYLNPWTPLLPLGSVGMLMAQLRVRILLGDGQRELLRTGYLGTLLEVDEVKVVVDLKNWVVLLISKDLELVQAWLPWVLAKAPLCS